MAGPTTIIIWSVYIGVSFFFFLRKTKYIKLGECGRLGVNLGGVRGGVRGEYDQNACLKFSKMNETIIFLFFEKFTQHIFVIVFLPPLNSSQPT